MPEIISNTSPIQYLHQLGLLHLPPDLVGRIVVPSAVAVELSTGRMQSVDLPILGDLTWITIRSPRSAPVIPYSADLGAGETEVLALALESENTELLFDDALARQVAAMLGLRFRGTLGVLLDAKKAKLVPAVGPLIERLKSLGFRLSRNTERSVLQLADELR